MKKLAMAAVGAALFAAAPAVAQDTTTADTTRTTETTTREGRDGFPWGVLGLIGLAGLLGRERREEHHHTTTTRTHTDPVGRPGVADPTDPNNRNRL